MVIADNENDLQRGIHKLNATAEKYNTGIASDKTNALAFEGRGTRRVKIVVNNKNVE
jgi:hypothetical protein